MTSNNHTYKIDKFFLKTYKHRLIALTLKFAYQSFFLILIVTLKFKNCKQFSEQE